MTPILISACDCAGPAVVAIAAATRATRTIHRVTIGRLLRDGEGWQGEYPRPPVAQARRFADAGFAGIFFVEICRDSRGRLGHASAGPEMGEQFGAAYSEAVCGRNSDEGGKRRQSGLPKAAVLEVLQKLATLIAPAPG